MKSRKTDPKADSTEDQIVKKECSFQPKISKTAKALPLGEKNVVQRLTAQEKLLPQDAAVVHGECTFRPTIKSSVPPTVMTKEKSQATLERLTTRQPSPPRPLPTQCSFIPSINNSGTRPRGANVFIHLHPQGKTVLGRPAPQMPSEQNLPLHLYSAKDNTIGGDEDVSFVDDEAYVNDGFVDVPSEPELDGIPNEAVADKSKSERGVDAEETLPFKVFPTFMECLLAACAGEASVRDLEHAFSPMDGLSERHPVSNYTPLHLAARYNRSAVILFLMSKGADFKAEVPVEMCPLGGTALHIAARLGNSKAVDVLLKPKGTRRDAYMKYLDISFRSKTALIMSGISGNPETTEVFTNVVPKDIPVTLSPFATLGPWDDRLDDVASWVMSWTPIDPDKGLFKDEHGICVSIDQYFQPADRHCFRIAWQRREKFDNPIQQLFSSKRPIFPPPRDVTVLPFIKPFLKTGGRLKDYTDSTFLHHAVFLADMVLIKEIISFPETAWMLRSRCIFGRTVLHHAIVGHDDVEVIKFLVSLVPEFPMLSDAEGTLPLELAIQHSRLFTVAYLRSECETSAGLHRHVPTMTPPLVAHPSWTPMHLDVLLAQDVMTDHEDMALEIIANSCHEHRDNAMTLEAGGRTPLDVARHLGLSLSCIDALKSSASSSCDAFKRYIMAFPFLLLVAPVTLLGQQSKSGGAFLSVFRPRLLSYPQMAGAVLVYVSLIALGTVGTDLTRNLVSIVYLMLFVLLQLSCSLDLCSLVSSSATPMTGAYKAVACTFYTLRLIQSCVAVSLVQGTMPPEYQQWAYSVLRPILLYFTSDGHHSFCLIIMIPVMLFLGYYAFVFFNVSSNKARPDVVPTTAGVAIQVVCAFCVLLFPMAVGLYCSSVDHAIVVNLFFPSYAIAMVTLCPWLLVILGRRDWIHAPTRSITQSLLRDASVIFAIRASGSNMGAAICVVAVTLIVHFGMAGLSEFYFRKRMRSPSEEWARTFFGVEVCFVVCFFSGNVCLLGQTFVWVIIASLIMLVCAFVLCAIFCCLRKRQLAAAEERALLPLPNIVSGTQQRSSAVKKARSEQSPAAVYATPV